MPIAAPPPAGATSPFFHVERFTGLDWWVLPLLPLSLRARAVAAKVVEKGVNSFALPTGECYRILGPGPVDLTWRGLVKDVLVLPKVERFR